MTMTLSKYKQKKYKKMCDALEEEENRQLSSLTGAIEAVLIGVEMLKETSKKRLARK